MYSENCVVSHLCAKRSGYDDELFHCVSFQHRASFDYSIRPSRFAIDTTFFGVFADVYLCPAFVPANSEIKRIAVAFIDDVSDDVRFFETWAE